MDSSDDKKAHKMQDFVFEPQENPTISIAMAGFEPEYRAKIAQGASAWGIEFKEVNAVDEIWRFIGEQNFSMLILDLAAMGAHGDSTTTIAKLRMLYDGVVFVLAPDEDAVDRIINLEAGADIYASTKWSIREVLAQIRAALRQKRTIKLPKIRSHDKWYLDIHRWDIVGPDGQVLNLKVREFIIMRMLIEKRCLVVTREEIARKLFKADYVKFTPTINNMISKMRPKLARIDGKEEAIRSVPRLGYMYSGALEIAL